MNNNEISLDVFEHVATNWLTADEVLPIHYQRILCRIVLTLIADVREASAVAALITEARAIELEAREKRKP